MTYVDLSHAGTCEFRVSACHILLTRHMYNA